MDFMSFYMKISCECAATTLLNTAASSLVVGQVSRLFCQCCSIHFIVLSNRKAIDIVKSWENGHHPRIPVLSNVIYSWALVFFFQEFFRGWVWYTLMLWSHASRPTIHWNQSILELWTPSENATLKEDWRFSPGAFLSWACEPFPSTEPHS